MVFLLILSVVGLLIVGPARNWTYAVALALEGAALVVAVATSHARADVRRARSVVVAVVAAAWVAAVAAGVVPQWLLLAGGGVRALAIPLALAGGLVRLVGDRGATLQAVAGSLAIYLLIGLTFAWVIGLVARLGSTPYFADGTDGTESTRVYFSFTVMTTTGFGDLTARTRWDARSPSSRCWSASSTS